jgi:sulfonate transport system substrate-binding protein
MLGNISQSRRRKTFCLFACALAAGVGAIASGCNQSKVSVPNREVASPSKDSGKIRICYLGLTCEPAIFVAHEKGFFRDEGLDVELVRTDWSSMRDGLTDGRFQASYSLIMYLIKPIELGQDLRLTGGIHTGCLRIQAGAKTDIKTVQDIKGKRLGVTHLGSPPFLFASRVLADNDIDPKHDVEWVTLPGAAMANALDQGRVDAVASAEPIGTMLTAQNKVRKVCEQASDAPYDDEYCCVVVVNGAFGRDNPSAAAKVTRALLKGAKWVNTNPTAAARLAVEKKYVDASLEINAQALAMLRFEPGIEKARRDVLVGARELKKAGFLKSETNPEELAKKAWLDLDGVTDDWIKSLQIEKLAGGGRPAKLSPLEFAALLKDEPCCRQGACLGCCCDKAEFRLPLTDEWAQVQPIHLDVALEPAEKTRLGSP